MKKLIAIFLAAALAACNGGRRPPAGFDREVFTPAYALGFEIVGADGCESTILRSFNPWQGAQGVTTELLILRNGEQAPAGYGGQVLCGEPQRIVVLSSTHIALLDAAGAAGRIVGVSGKEYVNNRHIAGHRDAIGEVGYEGNIDFEQIAALTPDIVMLFGINGASGTEGKLRELGIPFVYIGDYLEESPLGKAEWMVAAGEITGRREAAEKVFAAIPQRYEALKERVAAEGGQQPRVMVNTPYGDTWFMAPMTSYVARMIADAGGDYIYKQNTSTRSLPIDIEEAAVLTSEADVWIHVGDIRSLDELRRRLPKLADARCVTDGNVWNCDLRTNEYGGNDYWESGIVHPDIILADLIKIFHPSLATDHEPVYYRRLK